MALPELADRVDRSTGCIMGLAVGDALGCPVEGFSRPQIRAVYGQLRDLSQPKVILDTIARDGPDAMAWGQWILRHWRPPGFYSDDTQQALLLIDSLVACKGADAQDFARRALEASYPRTAQMPLGVYRGYGSGFVEALENLAAGTPARQAGTESAGNGAAMRIAPVGIYFAGQDQQIIEAAVEFSLVTHRSPLGLASAAAIALAVGQAACSQQIDQPARFLELLLAKTRQAEDYIKTVLADQDQQHYHQFSGALELLARIIDAPAAEAFGQIAQNASRCTTAERITAHHPFALASVITSLWYFLRQMESFEEAVCAAVNGGGDADTIGAITGALSGALNGSDAIPRQWSSGVQNHRQVLLRARALAGDQQAPDQLADFHQMELHLTQKHLQAQEVAMQIAEKFSL